MPNYQNGDAIDASEILYRRVPMSQSVWEEGKLIFYKGAFKPNPNDVDGLSLFLASAYSSPEDFVQQTMDADRTGRFHVVAIDVQSIYSLGFTVIFSEADFPGHVLIQELTSKAYDADKERCLEWIDQLVNRCQIVRIAPDMPTV